MERIYADTSGGTIKIGRQGENEAREIVFDISRWRSLYGDGVASLVHRRNSDEHPYPCDVTREDGNLIVWTVRLSDVANEGIGECELIYSVGGVVVKSVIWSTFVARGLTDVAEDIPNAAQPWVDKVLAAVNSIKAEGHNTIAGGKGFTIGKVYDNKDGTGEYTLSSVAGLEPGMRYSAVLSSANYNAGKIIKIVGNIVTVDGYKHIELNQDNNGNPKEDDSKNYNVYNCFLLVDHPELGDKEVGFNAHAEGIGTIAASDAAHAEGSNTVAAGEHSHAGGYQSEAKANGSFVHGKGLLAESDYQAVFGQYNKPTTDAELIIGNGDSTAKRSNALEVTRSGDAYVQGGVYVGGSGGNKADARELATKDYVEKVVSAGAANALTDTATGEYVVIDDASPLTREIKARIQKGSSAGAHVIKRYGKNLLDIDTLANNSSALSKGDGNVYTFTCKSTYVFPWYAIHIPANVPLTISFEALDSNVADNFLRVQVQTSNGKHWIAIPINAGSGRTSATITTKGNVTQMQFFIDSGNGKSSHVTFKNLMLEIGASPTEYELYKGVRSYNISNDEEIAYVEPFFPTTVLIPNIAGTVVECVYNKDTKTALDESYLSKHDASGRGSFAYGDHVVAIGNQAVFGERNETNDNAALIVGNGNYDKGVQSNAFEIMKSGDAYIDGKVYFGGTGKSQGAAKEVASKESVDALATMFAVTIKETASGEAIAITDVSPIEHEMGVKVSSKNILPYPYPNNPPMSATTNGITFTRNETDRSITISGIATGNAYYLLWNADLGTKNMVGSPSGGNNGVYAFSPYMNYNAGNKNVSVYIPNGTDLTTPVTVYPQIEEGTTATAYAPYIEDISTVKVKKHGENLYNAAANWTTAPYYSFCSIGNFPWRLTLLDKDTSVDMSGIHIGVGQYSASNLKVYSEAFQKGTIKWATKDNIATHPDSVAGKNLLCECLYIYPNTQEALDKVLQRFDIMVTGANIIPTEYAPYIEPIEYPVSADGTVEGVTSIYPATTLVTDTAGAVMDCTYNVDTKKYIDKKFAELQALILEA